MKDFIHRTIEADGEWIETAKDGKIGLTFYRTRTSNGFCSITAELGEQKITFSSTLLGDNYEQVALSFATGLQDMAYQSCLLPSPPPEPSPSPSPFPEVKDKS